MKFEVTVSPNSRLIVEADPLGRGPIEICDRIVDLSVHNLFVQPFSSPGDEAITPLKDKTIEVFRMLGFADRDNPLVRALEQYYENRLPLVLHELEHPTPYDRSEIETRLANLDRSPSLSSQVLRSIVTRIRKETAHNYQQEVLLGTFRWLASGGCASLPFNVAPRSELEGNEVLFVPPNATDKYIPFAIQNRTAFYSEHNSPTPAAVVSSLCQTGRAGAALEFLNQAAAMSMMTDSVANDIERAEKKIASLNQRIAPANKKFLLHTAINGCLGFCAISFVAQAATDALATGLSWSHLSLATLGSALGAATWLSQRVAATVRDSRHGRDLQRIEEARSFIKENRMVPHTVLSTVMLRHISGRGVFNERAFPGPDGEMKWRSAFENLILPDFHVNHVATLKPLEPIGTGHWLDSHAQDRIFRKVESETLYLNHVEAAETNSQLLMAIEAANFFASISGWPMPSQAQLPLRHLVVRALDLTCDRANRFPLIAQTFHNVLHFFSLSHEEWAFASRPLFLVRALESDFSAQQAQKIAVEELLKADSNKSF